MRARTQNQKRATLAGQGRGVECQDARESVTSVPRHEGKRRLHRGRKTLCSGCAATAWPRPTLSCRSEAYKEAVNRSGSVREVPRLMFSSARRPATQLAMSDRRSSEAQMNAQSRGRTMLITAR